MIIPIIWPAFASLYKVAAAVTVYAMGEGLGLLIGDKIYRRISVKTTLLSSCLLVILAAILMIVTGYRYGVDSNDKVYIEPETFWIMIIARCLQGLASGTSTIACQIYMAQTLEKDKRLPL